MTRKDYVMLAEALQRAMTCELGELVNHDSYRRGTIEAVMHIGRALARDNPHGFEHDRFLIAAGVKSP